MLRSVLGQHFVGPVVLANIGDPENWQLAQSTPLPPNRADMNWLTDRLVVISSKGKFITSSGPISSDHTHTTVDLERLLDFLSPQALAAVERERGAE
jgi:hypothetical protein